MENKFKDIKIGDTVYTQQLVRYGWNSAASFWIPKKVTKTTQTQFVTEDLRRFKKDDGYEIGGESGRAMKFGEQIYGWSSNGHIVTDQTNDLKEFKSKLKVEVSIRNIISQLKVDNNSGMSLDALKEVYNHIDAAYKIIMENK